MGVGIHLSISKSVTKEEWEKVYEESLKLVKNFPLAEKRKVVIDGIETICLVKTEERERTYGWNHEECRIGWNAVGDYKYMRTAEDYYLSRHLVDEQSYIEQCEDAMFGVLPAYLDYDWKDDRFGFVYGLWGDKTQGEPYHIYLLAIACMIEARLGNKAFIFGDITNGQCVKAVKLANSVLETPIDIPARCDMDRLLVRVQSLPVTEREKIAIYGCFYLGYQGAEFGEKVRANFATEACDDFWKKRFGYYPIDHSQFENVFRDYILWGFDLSEIFRFVQFEDMDGIPQYELFINIIMDAKLHWENKDCTDPLRINQDESSPYGIGTLFAQFLFHEARNKRIDRYLPVNDIRKALVKGLGDKCDVNGIIDAYLKKEEEQNQIVLPDGAAAEDIKETYMQDPSGKFKQLMDLRRDQMQKDHETYDISDCEILMFYEQGDSISPDIMKALGKAYAVYNNTLEEEDYKELMKKTPKSRCEFLVEQNRYVLIRDKDWEKIFKDINEHDESFGRYYPMVRVQINNGAVEGIVRGMVLNDALYEYCAELAEIYAKDEATGQ